MPSACVAPPSKTICTSRNDYLLQVSPKGLSQEKNHQRQNPSREPFSISLESFELKMWKNSHYTPTAGSHWQLLLLQF